MKETRNPSLITAPSHTRQTKNRLAKAIGSPLSEKELDARLKNAISGKEKGIPASVIIREVRKRLGL
jgi:hypothetical protein